MTLAGKTVAESEKTRVSIAYARVSSPDNKPIWSDNQALEPFCAARGWQIELVKDLGSGLNYDKRGLKLLLKRICSGEVDRQVLT